MTFSEAVHAYLALASRQQLYGIDLHPAKLSAEDSCFIGISAQGIRVYNSQLNVCFIETPCELLYLMFDYVFAFTGEK